MRTEATLVLAVALVAAHAPDAHACGPDFPIELLADHDDALDLAEGTFADEAAHLVPAPPGTFAVVVDEPYGVRQQGEPEEKRLYDQGADAFTRGDQAAAARAFRALLALPPTRRMHRSTWAAYMLGRISGGAEGIGWYQRVRALVADGYLDELGLAASSLGQEARERLRLDDSPAAGLTLYAEQAAVGDSGGADSLLELVSDDVDGGRERELLDIPIGQRLLASYLYSRSSDLTDATRTRLWTELAALPAPAGADRLAAAAYREGRWDLAATLAARAPDAPLSRWVRAELALRDGDRATADGLLATVAGATASPGDTPHVLGERAILALTDGRMVDAMALVWKARRAYPIDAVFVAERVLTIDELRTFVDQHTAADDDGPFGDDSAATSFELGDLREVLARRLMRVGRYDEAMPYFGPEHRARARVYVDAMERADVASDPIDRARALYLASSAARVDGLEILGTGHAPDWGLYGAEYDLGDYQLGVDLSKWAPAAAARVAASAPTFPQRYEYRYLAATLAERAADLLPPRSQAFAATLCHAARYVHHDEAQLERLWDRYTAEGATVDFESTFGYQCPEPAFERARRAPAPAAPPPRPHPARRRSHHRIELVVLVLATLAFALQVRRLRRARVLV